MLGQFIDFWLYFANHTRLHQASTHSIEDSGFQLLKKNLKALVTLGTNETSIKVVDKLTGRPSNRL